jgi:hypothetical protein
MNTTTKPRTYRELSRKLEHAASVTSFGGYWAELRYADEPTLYAARRLLKKKLPTYDDAQRAEAQIWLAVIDRRLTEELGVWIAPEARWDRKVTLSGDPEDFDPWA